MRYLSVCSGIEAASVAWHGLGWTPAAFSEIEPFPRKVLAHRFPGIPIHGDFTTIQEGEYGPIDVLVGGTPCQAFSVAGLREGLRDPRGNLALGFLALAQREQPKWVLWENVPGVLSSDGGRDFGAFLGGLVKLGYGFAYRVLDAQYAGVPQRRRRVFVVGYLGDWRRAAAVLFEREGLRWDPPPSREAREDPATGLGTGPHGDSEEGNVIAGTLMSSGAGMARPAGIGSEADFLVAGTMPSSLGKDTGNRGRFGPDEAAGNYLVAKPFAFETRVARNGRGAPSDVVPALKAQSGTKGDSAPCIAFDASAGGNTGFAIGNQAGALRRSQGEGHAAIVFAQNQRDEVRTMDVAGALAAEPGMKQQTFLAFPISTQNALRDADASATTGLGIGEEGDPCFTLTKGHEQAVAFNETASTLRAGGSTPASHGKASGTDRAEMVGAASGVRLLTPRECERLQGFPDGWTRIPLNRVPNALQENARLLWQEGDQGFVEVNGTMHTVYADGPRYKAIGNSMAVPVMRWIGERIALVDSIPQSIAIAAE